MEAHSGVDTVHDPSVRDLISDYTSTSLTLLWQKGVGGLSKSVILVKKTADTMPREVGTLGNEAQIQAFCI